MRDVLEPILGETGYFLFQFIFTFAIVLGAIAFGLWLYGMRSSRSPGVTVHRGRVPRIAIVDVLEVDGRRRLVLFRRDNVEHLVLVGGNNDVVVEPSIRRQVQPQASAPAQPQAAPPQPQAQLAAVTAKRPVRPAPGPAARPQRPVARPDPSAEQDHADAQPAPRREEPVEPRAEREPAPAPGQRPQTPPRPVREAEPRVHRTSLPIAPPVPTAPPVPAPPLGDEDSRPIARFAPIVEPSASTDTQDGAGATPNPRIEEETDPGAEFVAAAARRPQRAPDESPPGDETLSAGPDEELGQVPASPVPHPAAPEPKPSRATRVDELEEEMARLLNQISTSRTTRD